MPIWNFYRRLHSTSIIKIVTIDLCTQTFYCSLGKKEENSCFLQNRIFVLKFVLNTSSIVYLTSWPTKKITKSLIIEVARRSYVQWTRTEDVGNLNDKIQLKIQCTKCLHCYAVFDYCVTIRNIICHLSKTDDRIYFSIKNFYSCVCCVKFNLQIVANIYYTVLTNITYYL